MADGWLLKGLEDLVSKVRLLERENSEAVAKIQTLERENAKWLPSSLWPVQRWMSC